MVTAMEEDREAEAEVTVVAKKVSTEVKANTEVKVSTEARVNMEVKANMEAKVNTEVKDNMVGKASLEVKEVIEIRFFKARSIKSSPDMTEITLEA